MSRMVDRSLALVSSIFPQGMISSTRLLLIQGGMDSISPRNYLGSMVLASLCAALAALIITTYFQSGMLIQAGATLGALLLTAGVFYYIISSACEARAARVEAVLPDALQLISSN